ncbi:MAG: DotU family type IV/VI secretion system protein [Desulfovermiculus sp.]
MRFVDAFADSLAYVSLLLRDPDQTGADFETVRTDLESLLAQARDHVLSQNQEYFDTARFAVCAWIDEQILGSSWPGREEWIMLPLQKRLYGTVRAGEEFFFRLEELLGPRDTAETQSVAAVSEPDDISSLLFPDPDSARSQVVEVYAACLALGFTGRYFQDTARQELEAIKNRCLHSLSGADPTRTLGQLFPGAYAPSAEKHRRWHGILSPGLAALTAVPLITLAVMYLLYDSMLADMMHRLMSAY